MDINTALGMVSERPLQVGDWVELVDGGSSQLDSFEWPQQITWAGGEKVSFASEVIPGRWWNFRFRRVDPPRDEVAELREQLAASKDTLASMQYSEAQHDLACEELGINLFPHEDGDTLIEAVCALKQQLATVTRERDELRETNGSLGRLNSNAVNYAEKLEKERGALREQLATVQRVLVESLNLTEVGNEFAPTCVDVDNAMSLAAAAEVAIDTLKLSAEKHKLDAEEANKAIAAVQAEAAAMRNLADDVYNLTTCYPRPNDDNGYELSNRVTLAFKKIIEGTAGRELLDEMQRKEERIKELEAECESSHKAYEKVSEAHDRLWRKCNAAKLAYIATLRGKIDPAWFRGQPLVSDAERMANELDQINRSDLVILEIETVRKYRGDQ